MELTKLPRYSRFSAFTRLIGGISSDGNPVFGWVKVAEWDD